jgi:hypothetical protein
MRKITTIAAGALAAAAVLVPVASAGMPSAKLSAAQMGNKVVVTAKLAHFTIDAKDVGKANKAGMGHLHFSVDGGKYDYQKYSGANGALAAKLGIAGKYSPSVTPSVTYKGLPKGKHTARVFVVNNDHSNTGASAKLVFTVK